MVTQVRIISTPTGLNIFYEMLKQAQELGADHGIEFDGSEFEKVFELHPQPELEPCKASYIDDRYTGKCKKFGREARGWR